MYCKIEQIETRDYECQPGAGLIHPSPNDTRFRCYIDWFYEIAEVSVGGRNCKCSVFSKEFPLSTLLSKNQVAKNTIIITQRPPST